MFGSMKTDMVDYIDRRYVAIAETATVVASKTVAATGGRTNLAF